MVNLNANGNLLKRLKFHDLLEKSIQKFEHKKNYSFYFKGDIKYMNSDDLSTKCFKIDKSIDKQILVFIRLITKNANLLMQDFFN